jgi:hypothetical protein
MEDIQPFQFLALSSEKLQLRDRSSWAVTVKFDDTFFSGGSTGVWTQGLLRHTTTWATPLSVPIRPFLPYLFFEWDLVFCSGSTCTTISLLTYTSYIAGMMVPCHYTQCFCCYEVSNFLPQLASNLGSSQSPPKIRDMNHRAQQSLIHLLIPCFTLKSSLPPSILTP